MQYYSCLWWASKHIQTKAGTKKRSFFFLQPSTHWLTSWSSRPSGKKQPSFCLCLSSICLSISVSKPMQWKNDKQGESETTDRDELILVVYNSRHSDGVLFTGGIIGERRRSARAGAFCYANKRGPLGLWRVESCCQKQASIHIHGCSLDSRHAWKDNISAKHTGTQGRRGAGELGERWKVEGWKNREWVGVDGEERGNCCHRGHSNRWNDCVRSKYTVYIQKHCPPLQMVLWGEGLVELSSIWSCMFTTWLEAARDLKNKDGGQCNGGIKR